MGSSISSLISRLRHDEGQTLVEYALILVLVAVVVISALTALDQALGDLFQRVVDDF